MIGRSLAIVALSLSRFDKGQAETLALRCHQKSPANAVEFILPVVVEVLEPEEPFTKFRCERILFASSWTSQPSFPTITKCDIFPPPPQRTSKASRAWNILFSPLPSRPLE
jgi:hypothetical protein